uniref:Uncharacterized protein n=1 Tax=Siphoviridae sp. ctLnP14 TaxID=2827851 RepID=A0A8S5S7U2_9CAUD|nr:MAG TPA: hypothetical protein [Siphoviridae sp. ctLnP14]
MPPSFLSLLPLHAMRGKNIWTAPSLLSPI